MIAVSNLKINKLSNVESQSYIGSSKVINKYWQRKGAWIRLYWEGKRPSLSKNLFFLHIVKDTYFRNVAWKFHREIPRIGSVRVDRVNRLGSEVIRVRKRDYLKTTLFHLVDKFDRNRSIRTAWLRSHFDQNFCRYGST